MKFKLIILAFFGISSLAAQSLTEAVRFTNTQFVGTARTAGVAGSFAALGEDFGAININPAGLGDFYKSEFNFGISTNKVTNTSFLVNDSNNKTDINDLNLNISHLGFVIHRKPFGNFKSSNFVIGLSQTNNFTEEFSFSGKTKGTITERFAEVANGRNLDQLDDFEAGPAYDSGAIFDKNDDFFYETDFFDTISMVNKSQYIDRTGKMNELSLGWAGNYDNIFNVGIVASMPLVSFEEYKEYIESDLDDELPIFTRLEYEENLSSSGFGFNIKAGATARIAKIIRIGASYHSPTWLTLTDDYSTSIEYSFDDTGLETYSADSPDGRFKYKLVTPGKLIFSGAVILNLGDVKGIVNGDVEIQNYTDANFDFTSFGDPFVEYQQEVNNDIDAELTNSTSYKLGAEFAYKKLRVRAGVNGQGSPYLIDEGNFIRTTLAGGIGFRGDRFSIDFSGFGFKDSEGYYPYLVLTNGRNQLVNKEQSSFKGLVTMGFKF